MITPQEVEKFRAETKGTLQKIHFNNAGASLPPNVVVETVVNYLQEEALMGGYETEAKYQSQLADTYKLIARLINANASEIAIVENASTAWGLAFYGIEFKPGDEIITSEMEYSTNVLAFLNVQEQLGVIIKLIPNDEQGNFTITEFKQAISAKTKLIAITYIASTTGGMMPVTEIGKIAAEHGILYLIDACQAAGHAPLDVKEIGCDMLSVTGRKYLRAPRGTGFLYVRREVQDKLKVLYMDSLAAELISDNEFKLRDDARRFELYEKNRSLILGLGRAVEYALNIGVGRIWERIQHLAALLRSQLVTINGLTLHDQGTNQCGIVTFSIAGVESIAIKEKLAKQDINVSVGQPASTMYYMNKHHITSLVRASVHYYNTEEEIAILIDAIKQINRS